MSSPNKGPNVLSRQESVAVTNTDSPVTAFGNDKDDDTYSVSEITSVDEKQNDKGKKSQPTNFANATFSKAPPELKRKSFLGSTGEYNENGKGGDGDDISNGTESTISEVSAVNDDIPSSFAVYAKTLFYCKTTHVYSCSPLPQPLLEKPDKADYLASLAAWVTILRIMGDLPERLSESDITIQGEEPSVVSKVKGSYKIRYTKKEIDDAQKKYSELFRDPMGTGLNGIPFLYDGKETMLEKVQFICALGIYRTDLRDELYCQLCKQLSNNPSKNSTIRGWVLMQLLAGSFMPTEKFAACLRGFLREGPRELAHKVDRVLRRTCCVGTRGFPPSWLEFQAAKNGKPILLPVTYMNGHRSLVEVDAASTTKEVCRQLGQVHNIQNDDGFSVYISLYNKISCLGNGHIRIMDAISECEQHTRGIGMRESNSGWRLFYRKEVFSPWHDSKNDTEETNLIYEQIMRGITLGEYQCEKENVLVLLAAQKYYLEYSVEVDDHKLEMMLRNWMPQDKKNEMSMDLWKEKVKASIKNNFEDKKPECESLKIDIVTFAMDKWFLLYSRYYDASKFVDGNTTLTDIVVAVNSKGVHVLDTTETIRTHIAYIEITCLSKWRHAVTISTVKGDSYVMTSMHADDMFSLLSEFVDGLRDRSKYALVLQDTAQYGSLDMSLVKGDLVVLDKPNKEYEGCDVFSVNCPRTSKSGMLPRDILYILPTTEEPKSNTLAMLTTQLKKDVNQFVTTEDSKQHTLALFARYHFRQGTESTVSKLLSKASFKKDKNGAIWAYSRDPIKKPLLKKSTDRNDIRIFAIRSFLALQQFMGDSVIPDNRTTVEVANEYIMEQVARNRYLREEIFCQIMKQLTNNPNKISCDKGWQLFYFVCGSTLPSYEMQQECIKFLRTSKHYMAKHCLHRLRMAKRKGCRLFPPHPIEYEALSKSQFSTPVDIFMPDGSKQTIAVSADTKIIDIKKHIGVKLKLKSIEEFALFVTASHGIYSLSSRDYYYDCLSHYETFIVKPRPDKPISKNGLCIVMLRKLWVHSDAGVDKTADIHFHYPQEIQNYLQGFQKCTDAVAIELSALAYRANYGDDAAGFNKFGHLAGSILPRPLLSSSGADHWSQHVLSEYRKSNGISADDAKIKFLKIVQKWPTYGSVFFEVKQRSSKTLPKEMLFAVNGKGVHLINKNSRELIVTHDFTKVPNWAYDDKSFTLILLDGANTKHVLLETRNGHNIDDIVMTYISYIMNIQMKKKSGFIASSGESLC
ncbi:myosin-VIIa [Patella vulgata]|uniref:myosin-VIIa n=1 Tax=Patella vulgata TaxID=6465 RepID=UPI00217F669E|nr:myosin-VIIa [Patella vulgata]